ncbi:MAG TPA: T9SS type A sorting domain-containing protein [Bacteroidia bacterium]|nr:T9SS type A sorting domain-containing protein [Bacteroidia bacterium]
MKTLYTIIISLLCLTTFAATRTAVSSDDWSSSSTWGGSSNKPAAGDSVVIPNGITVTVSNTVDFRSGGASIINVLNGGRLEIDNGKKIRLSANSYVNLASSNAKILHGGGGNNTYIEVDGIKVWTAGTSSGSITGPAIYPAGAMPVLLAAFTAKTVEAGVAAIEWVTAGELNNAYFEVQRSTDMSNFETIEKINGKGTTMNTSTYTAIDYSVPSGNVYYRLVQVDFDGTSTVYDAVAIDSKKESTTWNIYPNPSNGAVFTTIETPNTTATISITDLSGKIVSAKSVSTFNSNEKVNVLDGNENLKAGFYLVIIESGNSRQNIRLQIL